MAKKSLMEKIFSMKSFLTGLRGLLASILSHLVLAILTILMMFLIGLENILFKSIGTVVGVVIIGLMFFIWGYFFNMLKFK